MFHEQRTDVGEASPADLREEYVGDLAAAIEAVGIEAAGDRTGLERETLEAIRDGDPPALDLVDAARVQALAEDAPDADTLVDVACEHLLLGMSTGVLDVETLAGELAIDLDPKEIQQKLERRAPMTLAEYAHLQHAIAREQP